MRKFDKKVPGFWKKMGKFFLCLSLAAAMILPMQTVNAQAAEKAQKVQKSRAIAMVYDNSGSMYIGSDPKAWCRAIYAMEVFSSMANNGDTIWVYPMNECTVRGATYDMDNPLKVEGGGDVASIRELQSTGMGDTPIEVIERAQAGLASMPGDEKWLVVLTDGATFYRDEVELTPADTTTALTEILSQANDNYHVMYLGIGSQSSKPDITSGSGNISDVEVASSSGDVLNYLTSMSNTIFGRDELAVGDNVSFDLDMSKLVIIVQGSGITDLKLMDGGSEVGAKTSEYSPRYSEMTVDGKGSVDESLSGMIISYEDVAAGNYTLSYGGEAASIGVYYEPDVALAAYLTDDQGSEISSYDAVYPGTYQLHYGLVDKNGNTVDSPLLGDKNFTVTYTLNGQEQQATSTENSYCDIELEAGSTLDAEIDATYLSGYQAHVTSDQFGWPNGGITCAERPAGSFEVRVSGGEATYPANLLEENGVYNVSLFYEGNQLTGADLDQASLSAAFDGDGELGFTYEANDAKDGMILTLQHVGEAFETEPGDYTMIITGNYTDEFDVTATAESAEVAFEITEVEEAFQVKLEKGSYYFTLAEAKNEEPIRVEITKDGAPLTQAELDALAVTVDAEGLNYTTAYDYDASELLVTIKADDQLQLGNYKLEVSASGVDSVGREMSDSDKGDLRYGKLPMWVYWLIIGIIIALIITIIAIIMNQKILPKDIRQGKTVFTLDGDQVSGNARTEFSGKKKKAGSLMIQSPKCATNPTAKCGVTLQLIADSPRRTKSNQRKAIVTAVTPIGGQHIQNIQISGASFIKDDETGKLRPSRGKNTKMDQLNIRLSNGARISITGEVMDPDGGMSDISLNVTLKYF